MSFQGSVNTMLATAGLLKKLQGIPQATQAEAPQVQSLENAATETQQAEKPLEAETMTIQESEGSVEQLSGEIASIRTANAQREISRTRNQAKYRMRTLRNRGGKGHGK